MTNARVNVPNALKETSAGISQVNIMDELFHTRNVYLNTPVDTESVASLLQQFMFLEQSDDQTAINFFINSPGGSVSDGMAIYDYIRLMKSPVRTICTGRASSMGAILFLAGNERLMFPHSEIMIHDASFSNADFSGLKPDELAERTKDLVATCELLRDIVAERTGMPIENVTEKMKKDSFFKANEAIAFGLATAVVDNINNLKTN